MSTYICQGFSHFSGFFLHYFVLAKLATSSKRVNLFRTGYLGNNYRIVQNFTKYLMGNCVFIGFPLNPFMTGYLDLFCCFFCNCNWWMKLEYAAKITTSYQVTGNFHTCQGWDSNPGSGKRQLALSGNVLDHTGQN